MAQDVKIEIGLEVVENLTRDVKKIKNQLEKVNKVKLGKLRNAFKGIGSALNTVSLSIIALNQGLQLAGAIASKTAGFFNKFITSARKIEDLTTQFKVLTGSVSRARKLIQDLQEFSARTPFQLQGLAEASRTLLAFGFQQKEIITRLTQIGDVAAATGTDIKELSLIFGQVQAAGKLTGERFLQLAERGINVGPVLAKSFGIAETGVRDLISSGKITFEVFDEAFKTLTKKGGLFFQGMIEQSKTLSGVLSTLDDNIELLTADIGKQLLPIVKLLAIEFTKFIQDNKKEIVDFVKNAIPSLISGIQALLNSIKGTVDIFRLFKGEITDNERAISKLEGKIKDLKEQAEFQRGDILGFGANIKKAETLEKKIKDLEGKLKELKAKDPNLFDKVIDNLEGLKTGVKEMKLDLDDSVDSGEKLAEKLKQVNLELKPQIGFFKGFASTKVQGIFDGYIKGIEEINKKIEEGKKLTKEQETKIKIAKEELEKFETVIQVSGALGIVQSMEKGAATFISQTAQTFGKFVGGPVGEAIGATVGQFFEFFGKNTEDFQKMMDAFIQSMIDLPTNMAKNIPYFIRAIIESLPEILEAWMGFVPILVEELLIMIGDPSFWEAVTEAAMMSFSATFSNVSVWISVARAFIQAVISFFPALFQGFKDGMIDSFEPVIKAFQDVGDLFKDAVKIFKDAVDAIKDAGGAIGDIGGGIFGKAKDVVGSIGGSFGLQSGGEVPDIARFRNDRYPAMLSAGENVVDRSTNNMLKEFLSNQAGQNVVINLQVGEKQLADVMLSLNQRGFRTA